MSIRKGNLKFLKQTYSLVKSFLFRYEGKVIEREDNNKIVIYSGLKGSAKCIKKRKKAIRAIPQIQ